MPVRVELAIVALKARRDAIDANGAHTQPDEFQVKRTEFTGRGGSLGPVFGTFIVDVYEVKDPVRDVETWTWGIREPRPDRCDRAVPRAAGFVLVPGVAFDRRGGRLGYGAGFYDRLLSGGVSPHAWLVAAFGTQIVEEVPLDEHQVPVDLVVTEDGCYPPGTPRRRRP